MNPTNLNWDIQTAFKFIFEQIGSLQNPKTSDTEKMATKIDQRKLALARTNVEQGLMWYQAACGSQPGMMSDAERKYK